VDGALLQDLAVQALNVSLMFSLGLELDPAGLRAAARQRRLLAGVTFVNFAFIPAIAYVLCMWSGVGPAIAAGILLSAFSPGGGTGTLLTRVAGGNLELSIVLLGIFTLLAVPLTPVLAMTALSGSGELDLFPLLRTLVLFQLLPLCVGVLIRRTLPDAARLANKFARPLSNAIFAALVFGLLATKGHLVLDVTYAGLGVIAALNVFALALPVFFAAELADRSALCLTTAVRNLSLALLLSSLFFTPLTTLTVLTYGLAMYLFAAPVALWLRREPPSASAS
jgi:BASS family bile acid:Na+ symporter